MADRGSTFIYLGVVNFTPRPLYPREEIPVPSEQVDPWALETVWMFRKKEKFLERYISAAAHIVCCSAIRTFRGMGDFQSQLGNGTESWNINLV